MASQHAPDNTASRQAEVSSPQSVLNEVQTSDFVCDDTVPVTCEERGNLHLVPYTWKEFLELDPPSSGYYDYIDGIVVWCPHMANTPHNDIAKYTGDYIQASRPYEVFLTPSIQVVEDNAKTVWTVDHESKPDSASSSSARHGLLHPDFAVRKPKRLSGGSSSSGDARADADIKRKIKFTHPYNDALICVGEITSDSTRSIDLGYKWIAYARSGVPIYIIIDRGTTKKKNKRVIVGSLESFEGAHQSLSANKHVPPPSNSGRRRSPHSYYRKVYQPNEVLDCCFFDGLRLTAGQLLSADEMKECARKLQHEKNSRAQRTEAAEDRALKAERRASNEKRQREESDRRASEDRRRLEEMEKRFIQHGIVREHKEQVKKSTNRMSGGSENGGAGESPKRDSLTGYKRAQRGRKTSAVTDASSAYTSSNSGSPVQKKSRKKM